MLAAMRTRVDTGGRAGDGGTGMRQRRAQAGQRLSEGALNGSTTQTAVHSLLDAPLRTSAAPSLPSIHYLYAVASFLLHSPSLLH